MPAVTDIRIRLLIHHPTEADYTLAVIGGHEALGHWCEPRRMGLGPERTLLSRGRGRCWEYDFTLSDPAAFPVEYRYLILDEKTGAAIWEREPNRRLTAPDPGDIRNGTVEIVDANFISGMDFHAVPPALFLGPYPQSREDVELLKAHGVTAVLSVQTDGDLRLRHIQWDRFEEHYRQAGIDCYRLPIEDFNEEDLVAKLPAAVQLLKRLVDEGRQVYVHCTAGMGRSPAVVVMYLSQYHGKSLMEALEYVSACRAVVCPNVNAIVRALETGCE
jgi:protein-tyrosine phosphatase